MTRWQNRPRHVAAIAFGAGAIIALVVVLVLVFALGDDDDDGDGGLVTGATSTPPTAAPTAPGSPPAPTPAGGFDDPDAALEAYVQSELGSEHIGDCPQEIPPGGPPMGVCSQELFRSADLVTFLVGAPFSEFFGEAVIAKGEEGSWSVSFVSSGELGETVAVGSQAVVFGAGNCLNFRAAPGTSAEVQSCRIDGTTGQVVEGPQQADGHTWWRLESLGWASEQFLRPMTE